MPTVLPLSRNGDRNNKPPADDTAEEEHSAVPAVEDDAPHSEHALKTKDPFGLCSLVPAEAAIRLEDIAERNGAPFADLYTSLEAHTADMVSRGAMLDTVFGVTSAVAREGKSTIALHLALAISKNTYLNVALLDLSLGDDAIRRRIDVQAAGGGVIDVLEGVNNTLHTLKVADRDNLSIISAGRSPKNASKAARSAAVPELIAATRQMFDLVIVDLPAISTGNALPIAIHLDKVLIAVRAGVTPKELVSAAVDRIGRQRVSGVVLNRGRSACPRWLQRRFGPV